jgi:hypothetical protein
MALLIPIWFYGFDSAMYAIATLIGFFVTLQASRLYNVSNKKSHFYLYLGFIVLSMGFLTLTITSSYFYILFRASCATECHFAILDPHVGIDDVGYWLYYLSSLVAYALFIKMYLPEKTQFFQFIVLPFWYSGFLSFNLVSIFLLSFVVFRTVTNYMTNKNKAAFLVMLSFILLTLYHLLLFIALLSEFFYVAAHLSLLFSFITFLYMLTRAKIR